MRHDTFFVLRGKKSVAGLPMQGMSALFSSAWNVLPVHALRSLLVSCCFSSLKRPLHFVSFHAVWSVCNIPHFYFRTSLKHFVTNVFGNILQTCKHCLLASHISGNLNLWNGTQASKVQNTCHWCDIIWLFRIGWVEHICTLIHIHILYFRGQVEIPVNNSAISYVAEVYGSSA